MKSLISTFKYIVMVAVIFPSLSCASESKFVNEAEKLCALYNPSIWGELQASGDLHQIYNEIAARQESEIADDALKKVLAKANTVSLSSYYYSVRAGVEAELGEAWECDYFDQFFVPEQTVVEVSLVDLVKKRIDPQANNTVVIMVAHSGEVLVNNAPLTINNEENIEVAVKAVIAARQIEGLDFVVYLDNGANGNLITKILKGLKTLGVSKVVFIDY